MSVWRGCGGTGRFLLGGEEGGSWGKHGFPHGSKPKARDAHARASLPETSGLPLAFGSSEREGRRGRPDEGREWEGLHPGTAEELRHQDHRGKETRAPDAGAPETTGEGVRDGDCGEREDCGRDEERAVLAEEAEKRPRDRGRALAPIDPDPERQIGRASCRERV